MGCLMIFIIIFLIIFACLAVEKLLHDRRLQCIPIRIHVNGTRGKSSVTCLIAAALRQAGIPTLAKITGTIPTLILPDGREERIRRWSPARILEQMGVIRRAKRIGAKAIVMECMAIDPALQFFSETKMIRATLGIITNVRSDHFEVMGAKRDTIAEGLSQTIPDAGILITGDRDYYAFFESRSLPKNTKVILADKPDPCLPEDRAGHLYFPENVAIAQRACALLGLDPSIVCHLVEEKRMGSEGCVIFKSLFGDATLHFADLFSANDTDSTQIIQERIFARFSCPRPRVALFNNRADRPLRMRSFAAYLAGAPDYDLIAVIGENKGLACRHFRRNAGRERVILIRDRKPPKIVGEIVKRMSCREFTLVGVGNEKGLGRELSGYLRRASQ